MNLQTSAPKRSYFVLLGRECRTKGEVQKKVKCVVIGKKERREAEEEEEEGEERREEKRR